MGKVTLRGLKSYELGLDFMGMLDDIIIADKLSIKGKSIGKSQHIET